MVVTKISRAEDINYFRADFLGVFPLVFLAVIFWALFFPFVIAQRSWIGFTEKNLERSKFRFFAAYGSTVCSRGASIASFSFPTENLRAFRGILRARARTNTCAWFAFSFHAINELFEFSTPMGEWWGWWNDKFWLLFWETAQILDKIAWLLEKSLGIWLWDCGRWSAFAPPDFHHLFSSNSFWKPEGYILTV